MRNFGCLEKLGRGGLLGGEREIELLEEVRRSRFEGFMSRGEGGRVEVSEVEERRRD